MASTEQMDSFPSPCADPKIDYESEGKESGVSTEPSLEENLKMEGSLADQEGLADDLEKSVDEDEDEDDNDDDDDDDDDDEDEYEEEEEEEFDFKSISEDSFSEITDDEIRNALLEYIAHARVTDVYDIDIFPPRIYPGFVVPLDLERAPDIYASAERCAKFAIDEQNKINEDEKLEFVDIQKLTFYATCGFMFYITLLALDSTSREERICQTQVMDDLVEGAFMLHDFRLKSGNFETESGDEGA